MATVQIKTQVTIDDLFYAIEQLNKSDFEKFLAKVLDLKAKRKLPDLDEEEIKLITQINEGLPSAQHTRFQELEDKRKSNPLSQKENTLNGICQRTYIFSPLTKVLHQPSPLSFDQCYLNNNVTYP